MKDIVGNPINVGDMVAYNPPHYKGLKTGTVTSFTPKGCRVDGYAINGVYLHSYLFEVFQHNKDFQDYISDYQAIQLEEIRPLIQVQ